MAVIRQANLLGQMRVDVPHLRAIESGVAADFDVLAGKMLTGRQPEILRGFTIPITNTIGNPASTLTLNVASGLLMHFGASSSGTIFTVSDTQPIEALNASNTNPTNRAVGIHIKIQNYNNHTKLYFSNQYSSNS